MNIPTTAEFGEIQHETCRWGELSGATIIEDVGAGEKISHQAVPICAWMPSEPTPPGHKRSWGGNRVDPERDCAVCTVHRRVAP